MGLSCIQRLLVTRDLFLAALIGSALLGTARRIVGDGQTHARCKIAYSLGETGAGMLHQERNGGAMGSATKAVVKLFSWADSKRWGFFVVKGTQTKQVGPALTQLYVSPDDIYYIDTGEQFLNK